MSGGTWVAAERSVGASSDKAIMDGARQGVPAGTQAWDISISKVNKTDTACVATWATSITGSLTYNTGRSMFNVTNGTVDINLYSELSSRLWSIEVLVEN